MTTFVRSKRALSAILWSLLAFGVTSGCSDEGDGANGSSHPRGGRSGSGALSGSGGSAAGGSGGSGGASGSASGGVSGTGAGNAGVAGVSGGGAGGSTGGSGGAGAGGSAGATMGAAGTNGSGGTSGSSGGGSGGTAGRGGTGGTAGTAGTGGTAGSSGSAGSGGRDGGVPLTKFVGNITTRGQVRSDFVQFWNQITPENEGKWGSVEGTRDQMNWAGMDRVRDYARQNRIPYKAHTFVWGAQQPGWIGGLPQSEQRAEVEEWIRLFCERYPDVAMIDVVNEPPPHTTPPYTAALGGAGSSGFDWIAQAFRWARQYCPNAILILNDYNTIEYQNDNNNIINIANRVKGAGAPIDAIGVQAHAAYNISTTTVENFLNRIATMTSLPIYVTEYDINVADDNRQRDIMQSQFTMFWNNPNVKGITIWGYVSGSTWLANSGLMSGSGQQRPAMVWLMDFLGR
jgi:endo-1,4-beta-xylanase